MLKWHLRIFRNYQYFQIFKTNLVKLWEVQLLIVIKSFQEEFWMDRSLVDMKILSSRKEVNWINLLNQELQHLFAWLVKFIQNSSSRKNIQNGFQIWLKEPESKSKLSILWSMTLVSNQLMQQIRLFNIWHNSSLKEKFFTSIASVDMVAPVPSVFH